MCLQPRTIKNPAYRLGATGSRLFLDVPCGKCAECQRAKKLEWQHRAYSEYKHADSLGGYTIFQTLTYSEENVPRFHNMRIFNPQHLRLFRARLRNEIERYHYPDPLVDEDGNIIYKRNKRGQLVKNNKGELCPEYFYPFKDFVKDGYKLIIASEYGGITHRPHYHALFHVTIPNLSKWLMHRFILNAWTYGQADDLKVVDGQGAIDYVAGYMCKDDTFSKEIESKLSEIKDKLGDKVYNKLFSDKLIKSFYPFHRQSEGYGLSITKIKHNSLDEIFERGTIIMPDHERTISEIPVPMYIQRKLFYNLVQDPEVSQLRNEPSFRWLLNDLGKKFRLQHADEHVRQLEDSILRKLANISALDDGDDNNQRYVQYHKSILELLDGRTIHDLATYLYFYKGRLVYGIDKNKSCFLDPKIFFLYSLSAPANSKLQLDCIEYADLNGLIKNRHNRHLDKLFSASINQSSHDKFEDFDNIVDFIQRIYSQYNNKLILRHEAKVLAKAKAKLSKEPFLLGKIKASSYNKSDCLTQILENYEIRRTS